MKRTPVFTLMKACAECPYFWLTADMFAMAVDVERCEIPPGHCTYNGCIIGLTH